MRSKPAVGMALLIGAPLFVHLAQTSEVGADAANLGLVARVDALEVRARTDIDTIVKQTQQIAKLENELKAAIDANEKARSSLVAQINKNRKEVYIDIGRIFVRDNIPYVNYPIDQSHRHARLAKIAGYEVGIRNGEGIEESDRAGTFRMMPTELQKKCDRIKKER